MLSILNRLFLFTVGVRPFYHCLRSCMNRVFLFSVAVRSIYFFRFYMICGWCTFMLLGCIWTSYSVVRFVYVKCYIFSGGICYSYSAIYLSDNHVHTGIDARWSCRWHSVLCDARFWETFTSRGNITIIYFLISQPKHAEATKKNRPNGTVLLSNQNIYPTK